MSDKTSNNYNNTETGDLEPALLAELTRALLPYLGPYSITTVKRASRTSRNPDEVILNIASHIDEPGKRELFSKSAKRILKEYQQSTAASISNAAANSASQATDELATSARGAAPITAELMQHGEAALATIIGPLAGVLVKRYARATDNSRDFFERLATHLRTSEERASFFESIRTRSGLLRSPL